MVLVLSHTQSLTESDSVGYALDYYGCTEIVDNVILT